MRTNSEGIVITDPEGTILWVNDAFSRITGYPPEEAVGKNPRVLKSGLHPKSFYVRMWTEIKEKGYWQSDIYNRRKNGEVYSEFLSIQAIPNEQREIAYFLARMSDITYLKKFEKEMTNELTLAQRIQKNILPQSKPDFPGVDFQCIYNPMEAIGGDFYDFIKLDEERMGIFISDISGHGVPAALITTMTKAILESSENYLLSPSLLMSYLNKRLVSLNGDMFLTGVYAVYHKRLRTLTFSRCAHPHPVIIRNGELIYLEENGSGMLGVFKDMVFNKATVELQKGDKVVFYTDGLTEGLSPDMVEFSTIFSDVLKQFSDLPVEKYIERIYYSFLIHCEQNILEDDVCLIGMEVTE
jgi:PAS domain S-box-containing protein